MRSGRPVGLRVAYCALTFLLTWVLIIAVRFGLSALTGQQ